MATWSLGSQMDKRLRDLQRIAQSGDAVALSQLFHAQRKTGNLKRSEIELLAILGFQPAAETLEEMDYRVQSINTPRFWRQLGKYHSLHLVVAAFTWPLRTLFEKYPQWTDLVIAEGDWDDSLCDAYPTAVENQMQALQQWDGKKIPALKYFKTDQYDWAWIGHRIGQHFGEHSPQYWLIWHLRHLAQELPKIRETMKKRRKYADNIQHWLSDVVECMRQESTEFRLYELPQEARPFRHQYETLLREYLLPRAIELTLF